MGSEQSEPVRVGIIQTGFYKVNTEPVRMGMILAGKCRVGTLFTTRTRSCRGGQ